MVVLPLEREAKPPKGDTVKYLAPSGPQLHLGSSSSMNKTDVSMLSKLFTMTGTVGRLLLC